VFADLDLNLDSIQAWFRVFQVLCPGECIEHWWHSERYDDASIIHHPMKDALEHEGGGNPDELVFRNITMLHYRIDTSFFD